MITDEDALVEEDLFILDMMKEMVSGSEVIHFGAAKQLLTLIERAVCPIRFSRSQCRS
jgi:son of sevenless-like protein